MLTHWIYRASFAVVITFGIFSPQVARSQTDVPSSLPNSTEVQTSPINEPVTPPQPNLAPQTPKRDVNSCPEGYFPSAFSDVPPDAWAYQAVIELASPSIKCFPNTLG